MGLTGSYEGNALFTGGDPNDDLSELSHTISTTLARVWKLRRGSAALGATASQPFYQDSTSLNDFRYSATGTLTHLITRRLSWSGTGAIGSGLARDSTVLTDSGLVLPTDTVRSSSSSSAFTYALSPESQLGWTLSQSGAGFSSALFHDGTTLSSNLSWSHNVGKSQSVGVMQTYSRMFDEASSSVYGVFGTWSMAAGLGWTAFAAAGVTPYSVPDGGYQASIAVNAGVTKPVRPGQAVGVTYWRSIEQSFGLSGTNNLVDNLSGNYSIALRRNLSSTFSGYYTLAKDPLQRDRRVSGQVGQASLSYRMLPNLSVTVGTSVYSRVLETEGRVTSSSTGISVNYVTSWR